MTTPPRVGSRGRSVLCPLVLTPVKHVSLSLFRRYLLGKGREGKVEPRERTLPVERRAGGGVLTVLASGYRGLTKRTSGRGVVGVVESTFQRRFGVLLRNGSRRESVSAVRTSSHVPPCVARPTRVVLLRDRPSQSSKAPGGPVEAPDFFSSEDRVLRRVESSPLRDGGGPRDNHRSRPSVSISYLYSPVSPGTRETSESEFGGRTDTVLGNVEVHVSCRMVTRFGRTLFLVRVRTGTKMSAVGSSGSSWYTMLSCVPRTDVGAGNE